MCLIYIYISISISISISIYIYFYCVKLMTEEIVTQNKPKIMNFVVRHHDNAKQRVTHKSKQSVTAIQSNNFPNVRLRGLLMKNRNVHIDSILGVPTGT